MSFLPDNSSMVNDVSELYEKIVYEVADAIVATDENGYIRLCNPAAERMFGWPPGQLMGRKLDVLLPPEVRGHHHQYLRSFADGATATRNMGQRQKSVKGIRVDGTEIDVWSTILRTQTHSGMMLVAVIRDVTAAITQKRELQRIADTDYLTGVFNRRAFLRITEQSLSHHADAQKSCSMAIFDIDDFKQINDVYGHAAGDSVLASFADILCNSIDSQNIVARWGGEEFIVFFPQAELNAAVNFSEAISGRVRNFRFPTSRRLSDPTINVTVSCGVACQLSEVANLEDVISQADGALYTAKLRGKDCVMPYREAPERRPDIPPNRAA